MNLSGVLPARVTCMAITTEAGHIIVARLFAPLLGHPLALAVVGPAVTLHLN